MKIMKLALLGGAAFAVTAASAQADELSDLKAQLESLNNRVAQLEAAPQVPAGYSLMTMSESDATVLPLRDKRQDQDLGGKVSVISVLPSADVAPAASIEWSGYVRAAIIYNHDSDPDDHDNWDVFTRGQLKVVGKTDTAVGEIGAILQLRAESEGPPLGFTHDAKARYKANEVYGWWAFAPGMTLGGGFTGTLGNIGYGVDGACSCYYTDNGDGADLNPGDAEQMRVTYESGPMALGLAVENSDSEGGAFAAELKYSGDTLSGEISGWWDPKSGGDPGKDDDQYQIGIGTNIALGDMAALSIGAAYGQDDFVDNNEYWAISALASITLGDAWSAELGYAYKGRENISDSQDALVGFYYQPVDQLTLGLEGEWFQQFSSSEGDERSNYLFDFVSVFRF